MRLPVGPRCNGAGNLHDLAPVEDNYGNRHHKGDVKIVLAIVAWFVLACVVGCTVGKFIHDSHSDMKSDYDGTHNSENSHTRSSIKHIDHSKESEHDSGKTRIKNSK